MRVKDLDVDEFKALIQEAIEEKLEEILGDPDAEMDLTDEAKARLKRSLKAAARGEPGIPAEQVAKELGLEW